MRIDFGERARALVGTRFRPQGRSAEGLDCIGLVLVTFGIDAKAARRDYRMSQADRAELEAGLDRHFRRVPHKHARAGDVFLVLFDRRQLHLAVRTDRGFVHAHAGIGRVVETPDIGCEVLRVYRRRCLARGA
jgi:murein DD-endopeptidase / murein LD-carboxypeptidase